MAHAQSRYIRLGRRAWLSAVVGLCLGCVGLDTQGYRAARYPTVPARRPPKRVAVALLGPRGVQGVWHVVQPGETLAGLARKYGITLWRIRHYNGLSADGPVVAGQWLFIVPQDQAGAGTTP